MWYPFPVLEQPPPNFYDGPELFGPVFDALRANIRTGGIDSDDLAALDEYHPLGRSASFALADVAGISEGEKVLDMGAGLGGASRVLARYYGAEVTALDATRRFCSINRVFNNRAELDHRITVVAGDAVQLTYIDRSFDVVWTQALWQDIEDKERLAAGAHRVLKPGGRLALFELVAGPGGDLHYPVPWADSADTCFLPTARDLRRLLFDVGFRERVWREGAEVVSACQEAVAGMYGMKLGGGLPGVDLTLVVPDFHQRTATLGRNVQEERIGLVQAVLTRD